MKICVVKVCYLYDFVITYICVVPRERNQCVKRHNECMFSRDKALWDEMRFGL